MGGNFGDAYPPPSDLRAALAGAACLGAWSFEAGSGQLSLAPALARQLGLDAGVASVPLAQGLARCHPADRLRIESVFHAACETGEPFEAEFRTRLGPADSCCLRVMGRAERVADGLPARVRGLAFDLTEGRSTAGTTAERTLRLANALAEHVIAVHGLVARLHNPALTAQLAPFEKAVGAVIARHLHGLHDTRYH